LGINVQGMLWMEIAQTKMSRILAVAAALSCAATAIPALADPDKDESGHGRKYGNAYHWKGDHRDMRSHGKEEFWDGDCKVERKWGKDGDFKEERKCRSGPHVYQEPYPEPEPTAGAVITLPPIIIGAH
jgi:hypothetical protein